MQGSRKGAQQRSVRRMSTQRREKWKKNVSRKTKETIFLKIRVFLSRVSIQRIFLGHENLSVTDWFQGRDKTELVAGYIFDGRACGSF